MTDEEKKAYEKYLETERHIELQEINLAFTWLEKVCRKHSCSDCPLEPRPMLPCAFATLKDHWDYLQKKENAAMFTGKATRTPQKQTKGEK